jgi:hypothetical protein
VNTLEQSESPLFGHPSWFYIWSNKVIRQTSLRLIIIPFQIYCYSISDYCGTGQFRWHSLVHCLEKFGYKVTSWKICIIGKRGAWVIKEPLQLYTIPSSVIFFRDFVHFVLTAPSWRPWFISRPAFCCLPADWRDACRRRFYCLSMSLNVAFPLFPPCSHH